MTKGLQHYLGSESNKKDMIHYKGNFIERVFKEELVDVQTYYMEKGKVLFISPISQPNCFKSYYVISGQVEDLETKQIFKEGDALLGYKMEKVVSLLVREDLKMLVHSSGVSVEKGFVIQTDKLKLLMEDLYNKEPYERGHSEKVSELTKIMGIALGFYGQRLHDFTRSGRFFDIGKIHLDEKLLKKTEPLSYDEIEIIHFHVTMSDKLMKYYYGLVDCPGLLDHHENWDGTGYPRELKGDEISLEGRIIAVCDGFDALVNDRPYRDAYSRHEAIEIIKNASGTKYDPEVVAKFVALYEDGVFDYIYMW